MNSMTEGEDRELPPDSNGEILRSPFSAAADLKQEILAAHSAKEAGQDEVARTISSLESRTQLRIAAVNESAREQFSPIADLETLKRWVDLDATAYGRIRSASKKEPALEAIAGHTRVSPGYGEALQIRSPKLAQAVHDLDASRGITTAQPSLSADPVQVALSLDAAAQTQETFPRLPVATPQNPAQQTIGSLVPDTTASKVVDSQPLQPTPTLNLKGIELDAPGTADQARRAIKRPIADEELPKSLLARFIVSHEKRGLLDQGTCEFTFRNGQLQGKVAFIDEGKTLNTTLNDKATVRAMVEVATAKNWKQITLSGTDEFKREAWLEAQLNGVEVKGYEPRESDKALLAELLKQKSPVNRISVAQKREAARTDTVRQHINADDLTADEKGVLDQSRRWLADKAMGDEFTNATLRELEGRLRGERIYTGELVEHGPAPYQFKPENDQSYFVALKTDAGEKVVWGKGLINAMTDRNLGDLIVLMNVGKKDVVVQERVRDDSGRVVNVRPKGTQLNEWKSDLLSVYSEKARKGENDRTRPAMPVYDSKAPRVTPAAPFRGPALRTNTPENTRSERAPRPDMDR